MEGNRQGKAICVNEPGFNKKHKQTNAQTKQNRTKLNEPTQNETQQDAALHNKLN
jgi:hypothetical protein